MPRRRLYLRDAVGRFRPKYGVARRYTHRARLEGYEREIYNRRVAAYRSSRVRVLRPDRVSINFTESPNRRPGTLKGVKVKR
jgi:hypothetical protein